MTPRCTGCWVTWHSCLLSDELGTTSDHKQAASGAALIAICWDWGMEQICVQGRLVVYDGPEGFQSEMGPCSMLGTKALGSEPYIPDFDAF